MIWAIIPHYGSDADLQACLDSIKRQTYKRIRAGVIDNNKKNRMFTGAINTGILGCLEAGASEWDVLWILNNDAIAERHCAAAALDCMFHVERCGIVGSKNVDPMNMDHIVWGGGAQFIPAGVHKQGQVSKGHLAVRTLETWITFSSAFVSFRLIREIGLLDGNLRHICSDSDYCLRAGWAGWKCCYEPSSMVSHAHRSSAAASSKTPTELDKIKAHDANIFRWKWELGWFSQPQCQLPPCPDGLELIWPSV